ncbi:putative Smr domain, tetratricopeptide-like helical domain superfamily [Helianthus annuus]|nr:putative Smr domain, tetratricopeptide-like helical domain superfamily [Helianthus annuus]KAJ0641366.1 putative Smr domain, tetratricopeptide-like helical domain superfamily [Helianthus annuus]
MAYTYGFCSSPSISFTQRTFIHPTIFQSRLPQLKITQISLQESVSEVTHNLNPQTSNTHQLTTDKKKNFIWVNPKSPKASTFKQKSYDSRYNSLVQVAEALNSCLPVEEDVFRVLDSKLGGELVEQDGVTVINKLSNAQTARIVLKYFQDRCELNREVVLYNVALKVFRKSKDLDGAEKVFDEMVERGVAPDNKTSTNWSLHLKSLSLGAALTALHIWINDLTKALEEGEELPPLLGVNTGHGKHKYSDKGLAGALEAHLKELNAPFHEAPDKAGWFLTTKVAVKTWLEGRRDEVAVAS